MTNCVIVRVAALGALALALGGCVATAPEPWLVAPADPSVGVRAARYSTVMTGVKRFDVVEPKDWRELNRAVGPQGGGGGAMPGMDMGTRRDAGGR